MAYSYGSQKYIWGKTVGNDGTIGDEITVATSPNNNYLANCKLEYNPAIGKFFLMYYLSYPNRVLGRYINSDGTPSGEPFYISKTTLQEGYGDAGVSLSGNICAFWSDYANEEGEYDSDNQYIYAQKITESGSCFDNDELLTPYSGYKKTPVAVSGNTDNNFLVFWKVWEGSSYKVYGIFYNPPSSEKGDIDANGEIDISDVILCLRMAIGLDPVNLEIADMNNDGRVDISDVILVLRKAIGLD